MCGLGGVRGERGGMHGEREACVAKGVMHGEGGHVAKGGVHGKGGHAW